MEDDSARTMVPLTYLEVAGVLAAVRAVLEIAPYGKPPPLVSAERKLEAALQTQSRRAV